MKKILRWMGLRLLRLSGWNVPDESLKRMATPVVLESSFVYAQDSHPIVAETVAANRIKQIIEYAKPYMKTRIEDNPNNQRKITMSLIVMRPDKGLKNSDH